MALLVRKTANSELLEQGAGTKIFNIRKSIEGKIKNHHNEKVKDNSKVYFNI